MNPVGLLVLATGCWLLERWRPLRRQPVWRAGIGTDLVHLVLTHTLEVVLTVLLVVLALPLVKLSRIEATAHLIEALPRSLRGVLALLIADLIGYAWHRFEHRGGVFWRMHAVHHSSVQLDWLASARRHPLGTAIARVIGFVPLAVIGFEPDALAGAAGVLVLWAILLHANLRLPLRWLRFVIATPEFHQRHHERGQQGNFSGLFPVWDLVGGTYLDGHDAPATEFGCDASVPAGYLGQLAFPFERRTREGAGHDDPARATHCGNGDAPR